MGSNISKTAFRLLSLLCCRVQAIFLGWILQTGRLDEIVTPATERRLSDNSGRTGAEYSTGRGPTLAKSCRQLFAQDAQKRDPQGRGGASYLTASFIG